MDNRQHNIIFHLHTVSGIVISVLVYVLFFAGSFSFFRDEIVNWERSESVSVKKKLNLDIDAALDSIQKEYPLYGRDIRFSRGYDERRVAVNVSNSKDTSNTLAGAFFYLDTETFKRYDYYTSYSLGEFLYRLHFFAQIPYPAGYYLSGFTALFLFFALLTGILVHWKKIITNFYVFRPFEKLKTVWTDAHTVLGTIGLPFQAVYAITGAFFMIQLVWVAPNVMVLYHGDENKLYEDLEYVDPVYPFEHRKSDHIVDVNDIIDAVGLRWKDFDVTQVSIQNYGDEGMHISVSGELDNTIKFAGMGALTYKASSLEIAYEKNPYAKTSYLDRVKKALYSLHFGDYGGYTLKITSFLLGLLSCFVVVSGILIWLEARNKKSIPEKRKKFNRTVGHIFLAICLTMYPVTAFSFIVTKLVPRELDPSRQTILYSVYFISWLLLSVFFALKKSNFSTNKFTLLIGGILGLIIPITNGMVTGNWIWYAFLNDHYDIFAVDLLWIFISTITLYAVYRMKIPVGEQRLG